MSVDLADYVDTVKAAVNPPGTDLFPDATSTQWVTTLVHAFWEAKVILGFDDLAPYTSTEAGIITPIDSSTTDDISRDLIQIIVIVAAIISVRNQLRNTETSFHAKAGSVEFETTNSATLLRAVLEDLRRDMSIALERLSDVGENPTYYIDALVQRTDSLQHSDIWFTL